MVSVPLPRERGNARNLLYKFGKGIFPMREEFSHGPKPTLGKDRIGRTSCRTAHLLGRDWPNRNGEAREANDGFGEFVPGTIATICHVTDAPQVTHGKIF